MEQENKQLRTPFIVGIALFVPCVIGILSMAQLRPEMGRVIVQYNYFEYVAVLLAVTVELSIIRQLLADLNMSLHRGWLLQNAGSFDQRGLESMTNWFFDLNSNIGKKKIVASLRTEKIVEMALGAILYGEGLIFGMGLIQYHVGGETVLSETFAMSFLAFLLLAIFGLSLITEGVKDDMLEGAFKQLIQE